MIIKPKARGFICITSHPEGCAANVNEQINYVQQQAKIAGPKRVLVIGASTGYGLASRIVAAFQMQADTIGVFFEKAASGKRTASAGWYNSAAFEQAAHNAGRYAKSINGDAFSHEVKQQVIDLIKQDWDGKVDLVIYSLASPRRVHPDTGKVYNSTLKPIGKQFCNKTVDFMTGVVTDIAIEPASSEDIDNTIAVMGGEDWAMWIDALIDANVLADKAMTVAYSYIGPELTFPIYRNGTIGKAKEHLEATAQQLDNKLAKYCGGHAYVSINKGLVTQASAAIPVVPLYISLLYKVMKDKGLHEGCIEQISRLFQEHLYNTHGVPTDDAGRIRIDDLEMREDVQAAIEQLWQTINSDNIDDISDLQGYRDEFYKLFGFGFDNIDYDAEVDPDVTIRSIAQESHEQV